MKVLAHNPTTLDRPEVADTSGLSIKLLEVGDVIYARYGGDLTTSRALTVDRVTAKRAYVGKSLTLNREVGYKGHIVTIGDSDRYTYYHLATPEMTAAIKAEQAVKANRHKVKTALEGLACRAWEMPADQCTALLEALAPFLSAQ